MARAPKLQSLAIFLLKEGIRSPAEAISESDGITWHDARASTGVSGSLAVKAPTRKAPWWVSYLGPHVGTGTSLAGLANASTAALLVIEAAGRMFAFSFGYGRHLLNPDAYEPGFGLRVVLNTVEPDRLTSVDARTFDELTMHTRRDVSQGSSFAAFGLDVTRDLVRAVTGPPRDEGLGRRASGSDALALLTRAQFPELPALCERLADEYAGEAYKERFGWIDHLQRVRDRALVERLDASVVEAIRSEDLIDMHLAPPEPLPGERLAGFKFSTSNQDRLDPDPRITEYRATVERIDDLELTNLKNDKVIAINADNDMPLEQWSVYRCIVFDKRHEGVLYALSAGHWYAVSESFADDVIRFATDLPELDVDLPDAVLGDREEIFNEAAAQAIGGLCLDQRLVATPAGDRIEMCDILTRHRQLIHVKKRGSSSTLSHLFSQGLVSAELLTREGAFRDEARAMVAALDGGFDAVLPTDRPGRDEWEVGFVVITRSRRDTPLTLPFFSLVNLRSTVQRLQDLGFRVSVRKVDER